MIAGKSYLSSKLPARLAELAEARSSRSPLRTVSVSLDDLYLPWSELKRVAAEHPGNKLLSGRGQAGTHDLQLAKTVLGQFKTAYRNPNAEAVIPVFEKSLHGGEGDRLDRSEWIRVDKAGDVDIVLFEGWMNGFQPCRKSGGDDLEQQYQLAAERPEEAKRAFGIDYDRPFFLEHSLQDLRTIERNLREYAELWSYIDAFVQLKPERLGYVWEWRLEVRLGFCLAGEGRPKCGRARSSLTPLPPAQQEHNMKAKNGGVGMTDEQVKDFIARCVAATSTRFSFRIWAQADLTDLSASVVRSYMPGYELWLPNVTEGDNPWRGRVLQIQLNKAREAVAVENF